MLGRYRIERELGRGGMGVVYVATDVNTDRLVALKTTTVAGLGSGEKTRNQRRERFIREVRALTQVNHPNVVHVFDAGEIDDADLGWLLFYTMEYVEGTTLAALVQERGALGGGEAAAIVAQVAQGLGEAHHQGIVHRDVKPANIFLSDDGRALIGDFGIAKIEGSTQITRRDQLVGTPNYLAPEQILGEAVGAHTDVFALGALFFVITQNKPLRQQVDASALLASANGNEPVARMMAASGLSEGLKRVVARCLERDPNRRYVDGAAFADALAEHATRVPSLSGQVRPTFLNEGTLDRSSAFLTSMSLRHADGSDIESLPGADDDHAPLGDGDVGSVEAAAMAMLGEVERRATGTFKQPERRAPEPLPVARTESTVMFNLRALDAAPADPTPVSTERPPAKNPALAESTLVVKRRIAIAMEPVTDEEASSESSSDLDGLTNEDALQPPVSTSGAPSRPYRSETIPTVTAKPQALAASALVRPPLPRPVLLAGLFALGCVLGLGLAAALAPDDVLATPADDVAAPVPAAAGLASGRPTLCAERTVSAEDQAKASQALDEARQLKNAGGRSTLIVDKLREGIALDPNNAGLFYEYGRVVATPREMDIADACVCAIAPTSAECRKLQRPSR
jgi:serine/threonine protein kinase